MLTINTNKAVLGFIPSLQVSIGPGHHCVCVQCVNLETQKVHEFKGNTDIEGNLTIALEGLEVGKYEIRHLHTTVELEITPPKTEDPLLDAYEAIASLFELTLNLQLEIELLKGGGS